MAYIRRDDWVQNTLGQALSGAMVYYCSQPATTTTTPPSPLIAVYADSTGTPATNPIVTDGFGHAVAYMSAGTYTLVILHRSIGTMILHDQLVGSSGGSGSVPINEVPSGLINSLNKTFALSFVPATNSLLLFLNGNLSQLGVNFTLAGTTITFTGAPQTGDNLVAIYQQ